MKNSVMLCKWSVLNIVFRILKISFTENSETAQREEHWVSPMCASNGIAISYAFTEVKLAEGLGGKVKRLLIHAYMDDNPCKKGINQESGVWKCSASPFLLSFVDMNRCCGLSYLCPLNDDIISSTTIDLKLF